MIQFEWDETKAKVNEKKHNVTFKEAVSVFYDEYARVIFDEEHSNDEERFVILGLSEKLRILVVVHCHKKAKEIIRIISARKATKKEQQQYREFYEKRI